MEKESKPMFSFNNVSSFMLTIPIIFIFEWNLLVSIRKSIYICLFAMVKDISIESSRYALLNPEDPYVKGDKQMDKLKHPF